MRRQSGFTVIEVMLVFIIIGLIGAAGWVVWSKRESTKDTTSSSQNAKDLPLKKVEYTQPKITDVALSSLGGGKTRFASKTADVQFEYPSEWGSAAIVDAPEGAHAAKGGMYHITFDKNAAIIGGLQSVDWRHNDIGHDGGEPSPIWFLGLEAPSYTKDDVIHSKSNGSIVVNTMLAGLGCYGTGAVMQSRLPEVSGIKFGAIAFLYTESTQVQPVVDKDAGTTTEVEDMCTAAAIKKYVNPAHTAQLQAIIPTISRL